MLRDKVMFGENTDLSNSHVTILKRAYTFYVVLFSFVCKNFWKSKHFVPKGGWLMTAITLAWLTTTWMHRLLQKRLCCIAFPYCFQ